MESIFIYELNKSFTKKEILKELSEFNKTCFDTKVSKYEKDISLVSLAEILIDCYNEEYGY